METGTIETGKEEEEGWRMPTMAQPELATLVDGAMKGAVIKVADGSTLLYAVRSFTPGYEVHNKDCTKSLVNGPTQVFSHYSNVTEEGIEVPVAIMYKGKLMLCNDFDQHMHLLAREVKDENGQPSHEMYLEGKANVLALMADRLDHHLPYFGEMPKEFQSKNYHEEIVTLGELVKKSGDFRELLIFNEDLDLFYGHNSNPVDPIRSQHRETL
jgi:hypothetical protein